MQEGSAIAQEIDTPELPRRRRRTREDVNGRICDAARELFAARGFHGATTREIARVADVSETLLFRYYGSKAALFDEVVAQPFNDLMQEFLARRPVSTDPLADEHHIFSAVYELIEQNHALFIALLSAKGSHSQADGSDDGGTPSFNGLQSFFAAGTAEQSQKYTALGQTPPSDLGLALRLAFGMLASSVLLRGWLFPDGAPPADKIVPILEILVRKCLDPDTSVALAGPVPAG